MKKALLLLFLLYFATAVKAQERFKFESRIHPEKKYVMVMKTASSSERTYISKNGKISDVAGLPEKSKDSSTVVRSTVTGKVKKDGTFGATMKIMEAYSATTNEMYAKLVGTSLYGKFESEVFLIDSIINPKLDLQTKRAIVAAFGSTKPDIDFPARPLKIGDSFKYQVPTAFPINGKQISFVIDKTYTLKSVKNNIAYFELVQAYTMKELVDDDVTGSGNGYVEFDIKENQIVKDVSSSILNMSMENKNVRIKIRLQVNSEKVTTIE